MNSENSERRRSVRFDTNADINFKIAYDLKTKVDFQVFDMQHYDFSQEKHTALTKNVSSSGMCFQSGKQLRTGDILALEVFLPDSEKPINMIAEVVWSQPSKAGMDFDKYDTGMKIIQVEGEDVKKTINFDNEYKIEWSIVLESVLGNFHEIASNWKKEK